MSSVMLLRWSRDTTPCLQLFVWLCAHHHGRSGWLFSGFVGVGDIRDNAASIWNGDGLGALLNALALIPGCGNAARVVTTTSKFVAKFVAKHPHMVFAVAGFVVKHVDESIDVIRKTFGYAIVDGLKTKGLSDDDVIQLVKKNVNLKEFHTAYKIGDDVVYVTLKRDMHVEGRHITGTLKGTAGQKTHFFPTGNEVDLA
jgi:hypothetical protein